MTRRRSARLDLDGVIVLVFTVAASICVVTLVIGAVVHHEPISQALASVLGAMLGAGATWAGFKSRAPARPAIVLYPQPPANPPSSPRKDAAMTTDPAYTDEPL